MRISTAERAILEALEELPDHERFHTLDVVFQGLARVSPPRLSARLPNCRMITVRRLSFLYTDLHKQAWRERLNPGAFDLGTVDRGLVKGRKIHPRYRIMVRPEFLPTAGKADGA